MRIIGIYEDSFSLTSLSEKEAKVPPFTRVYWQLLSEKIPVVYASRWPGSNVSLYPLLKHLYPKITTRLTLFNRRSSPCYPIQLKNQQQNVVRKRFGFAFSRRWERMCAHKDSNCIRGALLPIRSTYTGAIYSQTGVISSREIMNLT